MTDDAKLIERLKVVVRCGTDSTMRHSAYAFMAQDPEGDYVTYEDHAARLTALIAENERLQGALERIEAASKFWSEYPDGIDAIRYAHESTRRLAQAALSGDEGGV